MLYHLGSIFTFIGGIGMFLYGMNIMSNGLQKMVGAKFSNILKFLTTNKWMGIVIGAVVTMVIHSSGATTAMVVGFVNAGMLNLTQATGVIMGANIGTTVTAWLVSLTQLGSVVKIFDPSFFAPLLFGISALVMMFSDKEKTKSVANIFIGLGLLFIGLSFLSTSLAPYAKSKIFSDAFLVLGKVPPLAIITGAVVTALISSSTASVSILQSLALMGMVSKSAACFITVGQNIGTCVTTLISSANGTKNGKRAALIHLLFNVSGAVLFSVAVLILKPFIGDYLMTPINLVEISIFHTGFNVINTLVLLPFSGLLVTITQKVLPDSKEDEEIDVNISEKTAAILDERILNQPTIAIANVRKEIAYYTGYVLKNLKRAAKLVVNVDSRNEELMQSVISHEVQIDKTNIIIGDYLGKINNLSITNKEHFEVGNLMSVCSDVERIGDHAENIAEDIRQLMMASVNFSEKAVMECNYIIDTAVKAVENAIKVIKDKDLSAVLEIRKCEDIVSELEKTYRDNHIKRMSTGECSSVAGVVFLEIIDNLVRVVDHTDNIADYLENELNNSVV